MTQLLFGSALNTPEDKRQTTLDEDLQRFPYVNGDLFQERLPVPAFDSSMRALFIQACEFSWDAISLAIFGSLFQSVMNPRQRRARGAHYTTEQNILKLIHPLFLDGLHDEFGRLKAHRGTRRRQELMRFHEKLACMRFFDPACGCGNFLIIAYRELRQLEIEVLNALRTDTQRELDVALISRIDVDQFYGIEIDEFPARIAEVAMWMMDHIMNNRLSLEFGESYVRIPLHVSPHIHHADALETDWANILSPEECTYVLGNPPFGGSKYQTAEQRAQVRRIANLGGSGGTLDFVAAWFLKAGCYIEQGVGAVRANLFRPANERGHMVVPRIAFVATNSITQGEQVAQLWPLLFDRYHLEIAFAHRTFAWGSEARGKANVHVVIIGLTRREQEPTAKRLFSYSDIKGDPAESQHKALTAYLFDAHEVANRYLVVEETSAPLCDIPRMIIGS